MAVKRRPSRDLRKAFEIKKAEGYAPGNGHGQTGLPPGLRGLKLMTTPVAQLHASRRSRSRGLDPHYPRPRRRRRSHPAPAPTRPPGPPTASSSSRCSVGGTPHSTMPLRRPVVQVETLGDRARLRQAPVGHPDPARRADPRRHLRPDHVRPAADHHRRRRHLPGRPGPVGEDAHRAAPRLARLRGLRRLYLQSGPSVGRGRRGGSHDNRPHHDQHRQDRQQQDRASPPRRPPRPRRQAAPPPPRPPPSASRPPRPRRRRCPTPATLARRRAGRQVDRRARTTRGRTCAPPWRSPTPSSARPAPWRPTRRSSGSTGARAASASTGYRWSPRSPRRALYGLAGCRLKGFRRAGLDDADILLLGLRRRPSCTPRRSPG